MLMTFDIETETSLTLDDFLKDFGCDTKEEVISVMTEQLMEELVGDNVTSIKVKISIDSKPTEIVSVDNKNCIPNTCDEKCEGWDVCDNKWQSTR